MLLRAPLNPTVPADAQAIVSPLVSVMVTIVLLNVALMCAMPRVTPLRIFFFGAGFGRRLLVLLASAMICCIPCCRGSSGTTPSPRSYESGTECDGMQIASDGSCALRRYLPSSFTPFLPATVLRGPLRVRALERVRWPRTGRLRRWRLPR